MATTDSFGRVILVDIQHGIAVRMWKGIMFETSKHLTYYHMVLFGVVGGDEFCCSFSNQSGWLVGGFSSVWQESAST